MRFFAGFQKAPHVFIVLIVAIMTLWSGPQVIRAGSATGASLHLTSQMQFLSGSEGGLFRLSFTVDRSQAAPVQVPSFLIVSSHRTVNNREAVRAAIDGDPPRIVDTVRIDLTDRVGVDGGAIDVLIGSEVGTRTRELLQFPEPGLYPITVSWEEDGVTTSSLLTFIERLPLGAFAPEGLAPGTSPLQVGLLGGFDSTVTLQPNSTTVITDADRQAIIDIVSISETLPDQPITVVVRPELIEALDRSTAEDAELLARLQTSSSLRVLSNTFVDVDASENSTLETSAVFRRQLRLGEDVLTSLLPTHINPRLAWFQNRQLTNGGAILLAELGLRNIILGVQAQQSTAEGAAQLADTTQKVEFRLSDESSVTAGLIDPYLSSALTRGSREKNPILVAHHIVAELKALLLELDQRESDQRELVQPNDTMMGRGVLLSTNDGLLPSPDMVTALYRLLADEPRLNVAPAENVVTSMSVNFVDSRPVVINLQPTEFVPSPDAAEEIGDLTAEVNAHSSMLPNEDLRPRLWRSVLDVLPHRSFTDQRRREYSMVIRNEIQNLASAIIPPAATTFTLGGRDSPIRFSVRNDGDTDVRVRIRLTSSKLRFPEGDQVVLLPAQMSTAIDMPVIARSNGRFPVSLQLFTPEGDIPLGPPSTLTARVNALAGLGQLVTGIAVLLLLSWWVSHLRRERHQRRSIQARLNRRHPSGGHQETGSI